MIYWVFFNLLLSLLSLWEWNLDDLQVSCPGSLPLESGLFNAAHVLLCITSKYLYQVVLGTNGRKSSQKEKNTTKRHKANQGSATSNHVWSVNHMRTSKRDVLKGTHTCSNFRYSTLRCYFFHCWIIWPLEMSSNKGASCSKSQSVDFLMTRPLMQSSNQQ
jgi:hypothetical protein